MARSEPVVLWNPPLWTRHLASLLVLVAFVLLVAAYVPRNHFKAAFGHPMFAGVKTWAFAHLLSNGTLADLLLFGGFLAWSVLGFRSRPPPRPQGTGDLSCRNRARHDRLRRGRHRRLGNLCLLPARPADRRAAARLTRSRVRRSAMGRA